MDCSPVTCAAHRDAGNKMQSGTKQHETNGFTLNTQSA